MYEASFYENDTYLKAVSDEFMKLAQGHTYQYFDLTVGNRRIEITPTAPHPPHEKRWEMCIDPKWESLFKGAKVLDIGGAEGFYSVKANLLGAKRITMIERSRKAIECAIFIFEFLGIENIEIYPNDIRDFKFKDYDIIFLMRMLHWFYESHSFDKEARSRILNSIVQHFRTVCFINLDSEMINEYLEIFVNMGQITFGGEGFMGHMELWK